MTHQISRINQGYECPDCKCDTKLGDTAMFYNGVSYGPCWYCPQCGAYVGTHRGSNTPLGRVATADLRAAKIAAHSAFDQIWKSGRVSRTQAYRWLSRVMGTSPEETHIGMFTVDQCKAVAELSKMFLERAPKI